MYTFRPLFRASPGSTHGYDVCDHNEISPELGGREGLEEVFRVCSEHGLALIADFVPNHMGIEGQFNSRWFDVLEHGRKSRYAKFFDIEWNPRQLPLQDKIILPVLDDFYGCVLDRGDLHVLYQDSRFWLRYHSLRFPLCLSSYHLILKAWAGRLETSCRAAQTLGKVLKQLEDLQESDLTTEGREALTEDIAGYNLRSDLAEEIRQEGLEDALHRSLEELNGTGEGRNEIHRILEAQHYRLAYWKTGTHEINYRRFFAVDSLIGLRMERQEVFDECHLLLKTLLATGVITGVRIDHIDGLLDPEEYLRRLMGLASNPDNPFYLLVEKILTGKEQVRAEWQTHGTTGYDFTGSLINLLVASNAEDRFTRIYRDFAGISNNPHEEMFRTKLYIMNELFPNALDNFTLDLETRIKSDRRWRDWTVAELRPALASIIACLPVYRTYRVAGHPAREEDVRVVERAYDEAVRLNPGSDFTPFQFVRDILIGKYPDLEAGPELKSWADEWVCRLQQYTGAIMAKSVEDTFFYRYVRLFATNEVGHHPTDFGRSISDFHADNQTRLRDWPAGMLATSTHDTKMSEDVRARLLALSETPESWDAAIHRWSKYNHAAKTLVGNSLAPDANEEYLLYQILLGCWPLDKVDVNEEFHQRIKQYMRKAIAEAKMHGNWSNPYEEWLKACDEFVENILDPKHSVAFLEDFQSFAGNLALQGMKKSLVQVVLKLTVPGVPDLYQGTELWDFSLVDPDNRRSVDYSLRQKQLAIVEKQPVANIYRSWPDGGIKMHLIHLILGLRREHSELFVQGAYVPLTVSGANSNNFVAYLRENASKRLIVIALRFMETEGGTDTTVICGDAKFVFPPSGAPWVNLLSKDEVEINEAGVAVVDLLNGLPVAIYSSGCK